MTDKEKEIIRELNNSLYTVEFLEEWLNRKDNVFVNPVAALQTMAAQGFYSAVQAMATNTGLPCPVGSDIYIIPSKVNFELNKLNGYEDRNRVYHQKVAKIVFTERGWYLECDKDLEYGTGRNLLDKFYGKTWFLAQAKAEEALKKLN